MMKFEVTNQVDPLEQPIADIISEVKEKFSNGIGYFRMNLKIRRGTVHIDEVIQKVEETTNLVISRSRISGLGLVHKDNDFQYWDIEVWKEEE